MPKPFVLRARSSFRIMLIKTISWLRRATEALLRLGGFAVRLVRVLAIELDHGGHPGIAAAERTSNHSAPEMKHRRCRGQCKPQSYVALCAASGCTRCAEVLRNTLLVMVLTFWSIFQVSLRNFFQILAQMCKHTFFKIFLGLPDRPLRSEGVTWVSR